MSAILSGQYILKRINEISSLSIILKLALSGDKFIYVHQTNESQYHYEQLTTNY